MGKLVKPKKPNAKKPVAPRKPKEPLNFGPPAYVGDVCWREDAWESSDLFPQGNQNFYLEVEVDGGWLEINGNDIHFYPISSTYDSDMEEYADKMKAYEKKKKEYQPKLDEYNAIMAEYEVEFLEWKRQVAEKNLLKAREKLT